MNENEKSCASTDQPWNTWDSINWLKCEMAVKKLQARIVKAQKRVSMARSNLCNGYSLIRFTLKHWQ